MPKLLVSVRSAQEASLAFEAGVDLIDIKEPGAGSLGAAPPATIDEILCLIGQRCLTSFACGELLDAAAELVSDPRGCDPARRPFPQRFADYAKVGLAGCGPVDHWRELWRQFAGLLPPETTPVAVLYADWREANSPPPEQVIELACTAGRAAVLIDTFDKSGPGLLRIHSLAAIQGWIEEVHKRSSAIVVAGQLTLADAEAVASLGPDYVGVRGGVCRPNRNGDLDLRRLLQWRATICRDR
jgi:(5-formylfuran-3-yl)methyl phosphate synthase